MPGYPIIVTKNGISDPIRLHSVIDSLDFQLYYILFTILGTKNLIPNPIILHSVVDSLDFQLYYILL